LLSFDLIIWDCDGCLVDSEILSCSIAARYLTAWGYPISTTDFIDRFAGRGFDAIGPIVEVESGRPFASFDMSGFRQEVMRSFTEELKEINGVAKAVAKLSAIDKCIASGSTVERNTHALKKVGLYPSFEDVIYCSYDVPKGKPAPDIFLYAAEKHDVSPARCLVIEDSVHGVQAARAAGMRVFAFLGASHITPAWRTRVQGAKPDVVFDDMSLLPQLVMTYNA
jgi:HAD superfamily hydrolase (TIGR01509 family)